MGRIMTTERAFCHEPEASVLMDLLRRMLLIRIFEEKICDLYPLQEMKTPVHLCIGQEAVAGGVCAALDRSDYVVGTHRGHGHYLAKGGNPRELAAELFGRKTGCSGGKGGSQHLVASDAGFLGSSAIVGGGIPIAVGAALSCSIRKTGKVVAVFFGDGAADQGVLHESLNFAAMKRLPVLFVLEDNQYATCSHRSKRHAMNSLCRLAEAYAVPAKQVDGNDAKAVYCSASVALERARSGRGPSFLECRTFRWEAHVGPEKDPCKGYPSEEEIRFWTGRCPIERLARELELKSLLSNEEIRTLRAEVRQRVEEAFAFAMNAPFPDDSDLFTNVW